MDLTFQVFMQYCSLQHRILLLWAVTSTTGHCFCFVSIPSFLLELFLHWSPVAYWASTDLGSSSFSVLSFCLFILFMGFSRQEYWSDLPFPSPADHVLSDFAVGKVYLKAQNPSSSKRFWGLKRNYTLSNFWANQAVSPSSCYFTLKSQHNHYPQCVDRMLNPREDKGNWWRSQRWWEETDTQTAFPNSMLL